MPRFVWKPDHLETLKRMARLGRTSYEISVAIGVCRNSVCSKCHRLGIRLRGRPFGPVNRGGGYRWKTLTFRRVHTSHAKIAGDSGAHLR